MCFGAAAPSGVKLQISPQRAVKRKDTMCEKWYQEQKDKDKKRGYIKLWSVALYSLASFSMIFDLCSSHLLCLGPDWLDPTTYSSSQRFSVGTHAFISAHMLIPPLNSMSQKFCCILWKTILTQLLCLCDIHTSTRACYSKSGKNKLRLSIDMRFGHDSF